VLVKNTLIKIKKKILGEKRIKIYSDDTFLVGFPKSGNTWLQFQLACLLTDDFHQVDYDTIHRYVPDSHYIDNKGLKAIKRPRVIKSHLSYTSRFPRVIYIARDPRDVAISFYYHMLKMRMISQDLGLNSFIEQFVKGKVGSYGSWSEHVNGWMNHALDPGDFTVVKYEDLHLRNFSILKDLAMYIGVEKSDKEISGIIEHCSFGKMSKMEKEHVLSHDVFSKSRDDIDFVRKGKSGGWMDELSDESIELIVANFSDPMTKLGYL